MCALFCLHLVRIMIESIYKMEKEKNMQYQILESEANPVGTSLKGHVWAMYDELVETFGEPKLGADKCTVEWAIRFLDPIEGTEFTATIYDWKEDSTPYGMYEWHIGGLDISAVWAVSDYLELTRNSNETFSQAIETV